MTKTYKVATETAERAWLDAEGYLEMYRRYVEDNERFWAEQANCIEWTKRFTQVKDVSFRRDDLHIRWYYDGTLNVCYNCVDRHLPGKQNEPAIVWEGDDPDRSLSISYGELHLRVCRFANSLKALGAKKGDRITLYMPMIPEAAVAMLACARIGAVHSVVFGGFSPEALAGRIIDCESNIVITADQGLRGGKTIPLKANVDAAANHPDVSTLEKVLVVRNTGAKTDWVEGRDHWLHDLEASVASDCPCEEMGAEDPLFILHFRFDRQAQGSFTHHRRLSGLCGDHIQIHFRLPARRDLLVHGGCRLGDRPHVYSVRPAGKRGRHPDVRGCAKLSERIAILGSV